MNPITAVSVPTSPQDIRFDQQGRMVGVDGLLDQIAAAAARQATPLLRDVALPALQRDRELQRTVGIAIGTGLGQQIKPVLWVAAGLLGLIAWGVWRNR